MKVMMAAVVIACAMAAAAAGEAKAPPTRCTAPVARLGSDPHRISAAGGRCVTIKKIKSRKVKKAVKASFFYQYHLSDQSGNSCGDMQLKSGRTLTLTALPYTLKVRFGAAPRGRHARIVWAAWKIFRLGGQDWQCGVVSAVPAPPPAALCQWDSGSLTFGYTGTCGVPLKDSSQWAGAAAMDTAGEVAAGPVANPSGSCSYVPSRHAPVTWFTPTPITVNSFLSCPDGSGAVVGLMYVQLGHYDANHQLVIDCSAKPDGLGVTEFTVPPDLGGVLLTDFWIVPVPASHQVGREFESQTSIFELHGNKNGCPLNLASVNH